MATSEQAEAIYALKVGRTVIVTDNAGKQPAAATVVRPALGGLITIQFVEHGFARPGCIREVNLRNVRIPEAFEVVR